MRKRLRIGNSRALIFSKEILDRLDVEDEVEIEIVGNILMITPPDIDPVELKASLAYLASKRERVRVYERLAE